MQKNIGGDSFYLFISCLLTLKNPTMRVRWKQQQKKLNKNKKWLWSFAEGKFTLLSILFLYLCWEFLASFLISHIWVDLVCFSDLALVMYWFCESLIGWRVQAHELLIPTTLSFYFPLFFSFSFSFFHQIINSLNVSKFYSNKKDKKE